METKLGKFALEYAGRALKAFSDADCGNDIAASRSTSGAVTTFNGSAVAWFARRQKRVALSTAEAEYMAMVEAMRVATPLALSLWRLGMISKTPAPFFVDNQPVVRMIESMSGTKLRRTIRIRHHYLQAQVTEAEIEIRHIQLLSRKQIS